MRAFTDWAVDPWLPTDSRLHCSVPKASKDTVQAAAEIRRLGSDTKFVQTLMPAASHFPFGHRMYHPIYEDCAEVGMPIYIHFETEGNRDYTPWVRKMPSEFLRFNIRFGTQPFPEPVGRERYGDVSALVARGRDTGLRQRPSTLESGTNRLRLCWARNRS